MGGSAGIAFRSYRPTQILGRVIVRGEKVEAFHRSWWAAVDAPAEACQQETARPVAGWAVLFKPGAPEPGQGLASG
jgi:hypothetical protein